MRMNFYFEIYDINDEKVEFPLYQEYNNDIEYHFLFSTYYYEALLLMHNKSNDRRFEYIDYLITKFEKIIEELAYICNEENYRDYRRWVLDNSRIALSIFRGNNILNDGHLFSYNFEISNNVIRHIDKIFESYDRCVALAFPTLSEHMNELNSYYSLSGFKRDYIGNLGIGHYNLALEYKKINELIESVYGYKFIECHLDDNVERYVYFDTGFSSKRVDWYTCDGRVLNKPISLYRDIKHSHVNVLIPYYSCCERKILGKMGFTNRQYINLINGRRIINRLNDYIFVIKNRPCKMCLPALIGCKDIYIYGDLHPHRVVLSYGHPKTPLKLV